MSRVSRKAEKLAAAARGLYRQLHSCPWCKAYFLHRAALEVHLDSCSEKPEK